MTLVGLPKINSLGNRVDEKSPDAGSGGALRNNN